MAKKQPGKLSLADLWDDTDPSEASNQFPEGEHVVRLNEIVIKEDAKKGTAAFAQYEGLDGDIEGKKGRQMYKLTDADGGKAQGMAFLMRDLALLGYEGVKGSKLKKTLKEISEEQPMVAVTAKENGQYLNIYLNGPADGDVGGGDDDDDDEEEAEIEVGSRVTDGDIEGEVIAIKGEKVTVKDDDDKKHKLELSDLELVEEEDDDDDDEEEEEKPKKGAKKKKDDDDDDDDDDEEEEAEIKVGDTVEGEDMKGEEITGEVVKIKDDQAVVKDEDGKKRACELDSLTLVDDDDDDDDDEEEEEEIEEGDTVTFEDDDEEEQEGVVQSVKGGKAKVKVGKKVHTVDVDELEKVDDDD